MNSHLPDLSNRRPWEYFTKRIRSAAELKRLIPFQSAGTTDLLNALNQPARTAQRGIYIHIPFCNKSCSFCGYYKCVNPEKNTVNQFVDALKKQIIQLSEKEWVKSARFDALYFGGGTPTALPVSLFFGLLDVVCKYLPVNADAEITLESTITELDDDYLKRLKRSQVNRVSLGVQSFHENIRKKYSRLATQNDIISKITEIRDSGIDNCCVDLIYNLEGQTEQYWIKDLHRIKENEITGCSVYPLLPLPSAPLVKSGKYSKPAPEKEYRYFKLADDFLLNLPEWRTITSVQYGHSSRGNARYVELQAEDADILAIGPGAGGKIEDFHYLNRFSVDEFTEDSPFPHDKSVVFKLPGNYGNKQQKIKFFRKSFMDKAEFNASFQDVPEFVALLQEHSFLTETSKNKLLTASGKFWAANLIAILLEQQLFKQAL